MKWIEKNPITICVAGSVVIDAVTMTLFHHSVFDVILDGVMGTIMGSSLYMFLPKKKLTWDEYMAAKMTPVDGLNMVDVASDIRSVTENIAKINSIIPQIRNPSISLKLKDIIKVCNDLEYNFRQDPKDLDTARLWVDQYFPKFVQQVLRYKDLSIKGTDSQEAQLVLVKFEKMLPGVLERYKGVLETCLNNDITDLSVGTGVYQKLIDGKVI